MAIHPDQLKPDRKSALGRGGAAVGLIAFFLFLVIFGGDFDVRVKLTLVAGLVAVILTQVFWGVARLWRAAGSMRPSSGDRSGSAHPIRW